MKATAGWRSSDCAAVVGNATPNASSLGSKAAHLPGIIRGLDDYEAWHVRCTGGAGTSTHGLESAAEALSYVRPSRDTETLR